MKEHKAPKEAPKPEDVIMVKAVEIGHFGHLREKGDVFEIRGLERIDPETRKKVYVSAEQQFSKKWMKKLTEKEARKIEDAKEESDEPSAEADHDSGVI